MELWVVKMIGNEKRFIWQDDDFEIGRYIPNNPNPIVQFNPCHDEQGRFCGGPGEGTRGLVDGTSSDSLNSYGESGRCGG